MIKTLHSKHKNFHQKFLLGWITTNIAFVVIISFGLWQYNRSQTLLNFDLLVHHLAFKLDELAESMFDSLESIPVYSDEQSSCEKKIPELERIIFKSPYLSGIVISSPTNKILCATNDSGMPLPHFESKSPFLFGPLKLTNSSSEVYLLQKRFGQYNIGAYFLKDIFENLFKNLEDKFSFTGLYDTNSGTMIFKIGNHFTNEELLKSVQNEMLVNMNINNQSEAILPLNNLSNIKLVIGKNSTDFIKNLVIELLICLLPLLLLSWWFFNYSKKIISKRFSMEYALVTALQEERFFPYISLSGMFPLIVIAVRKY